MANGSIGRLPESSISVRDGRGCESPPLLPDMESSDSCSDARLSWRRFLAEGCREAIDLVRSECLESDDL